MFILNKLKDGYGLGKDDIGLGKQDEGIGFA